MVNHAIKEKKLAHIRYDMCLDGNSDLKSKYGCHYPKFMPTGTEEGLTKIREDK